MKLTILFASFILAIGPFAVTRASAQTDDPLPSVSDVLEKMSHADAEHRAAMAGYTGVRRYVAVNRARRAEMVVRVECSSEGTKQFTIISEAGSHSIRKQVFYKMLSEESEASRRDTRDGNRITPANYTFTLIRRETLDTGPAYVLSVIPKTENKYLIDGRIWVNANDYSIVRIEGQPARNPSFWVHNVHFVHTYQRVGQFWLASSTNTTSEVRIFGPSELTIDNSDYVLKAPQQRTSVADSLASLVR
jgi:hypothetical protein